MKRRKNAGFIKHLLILIAFLLEKENEMNRKIEVITIILCVAFYLFGAVGAWATSAEIYKLVNDLHSLDDSLRENAVKELSKIGKPAVKAVMDYMGKAEVYLGRANGAKVLGNIGDKAAVPALVKGLKDEYADVRVNSAVALGKIRDRKAVTFLIKALGDEINDVKAAAALALGNIGDKSAVPELKKLLKSDDEKVRNSAKSALNKLK